jgi:Ulp1 family protease
LLLPLNPGELDVINTQLHGHQREPEETIVKQNGTDIVTLKRFRTLRPGEWLSDEIIHYYFRLLQQRDDELCKTDPTHAKCHFFKSFFMTKLNNEGHLERDGEYDYSNVKRWARSE